MRCFNLFVPVCRFILKNPLTKQKNTSWIENKVNTCLVASIASFVIRFKSIKSYFKIYKEKYMGNLFNITIYLIKIKTFKIASKKISLKFGMPLALHIISRLGQSQGLLYKQFCHKFINWLSHWWFVKISLWRRQALWFKIELSAIKRYKFCKRF